MQYIRYVQSDKNYFFYSDSGYKKKQMTNSGVYFWHVIDWVEADTGRPHKKVADKKNCPGLGLDFSRIVLRSYTSRYVIIFED